MRRTLVGEEPLAANRVPTLQKAISHVHVQFALIRYLLCAAVLAAGLSLPVLAAPPEPPAAAAQAPSSSLSGEVMYKILIAEFALQRGEAAFAARAYLEAAQDAQDAGLARRATEIALFARRRATALESARLWQQLDPSAERAKQLVATLSQPGAGADLKTELERVLAEAAANGQALGDAFIQLNRALSTQEDKTAVFRLVVALAKPYPDVPEAHFAIALAGYNTGLRDLEIVAESVRAADRALQLKPGWERAALLKADMLAKSSPESAIRYLSAFVADAPHSRAAAGALAQLYVEQKRYGDARAVFQRLLDEHPAERELEFAVAAVSAQMKDYATAERLFKELKAEGYGEPGVVALYLAQIAEETKRYDDAIAFYGEVTDGERAWAAQLRIAAMMAKKGDVDAARRYLAALAPDGDEERTQLKQAEAQLLRDAGDYRGAYAVLTAALVAEPDSADLLYDLAMVAEKLDRIDEVEQRLKHLIELKPDNAHALNALGYTLVDRTKRAAEGLKLIEQAHALAPDDPFILDSMGWAHFRLGDLGASEQFLRRALTARPDPEIAAHLGEVLWAKGERDRAKEIWQSQLKDSPDNPVLLETMRRLTH